jgi:hypothetical protein
MERDPKVSQLIDRLNALNERIAKARISFQSNGPVGDSLAPEFEQNLATFSKGHDDIRKSIESYQAMTNEVLSTATAATDNLEKQLKAWLLAVEQRFNGPRRTTKTTSM